MARLLKDITIKELTEIIREIFSEENEGVAEEEIRNILTGDHCVDCGRIYYNCVCSHEED